ncbi:MAG: tyrosine-type recombinase/integrase [Thiotrichaceae bacterium]|nr:tyrosine-type recombinase/integrase [Thiotrichaceae bacterium]
MNNLTIKNQFNSPLAELMDKFINEKQACGYRYQRETQELLRLDRFLCEKQLQSIELPREIVDEWTAKKEFEKASNQKLRIIRIRQLALYLQRQGLDAYVPDNSNTTIKRVEFVPYIFSHQQIKNIFEAADNIALDNRSPHRHLIMPEVFRLLYCCGMRVSEVVNLKSADIDLATGVLTIRESKFNKDRLIPLSPSMTIRIRKYASILEGCHSTPFFFPTITGSAYSKVTIYSLFRQLLWKCRIEHCGRGKGPRLLDLRHSFAVHRLESWYKQGVDFGVKLPLLSAYMGHKNIISTQWYLQLTPEIFPDIVNRLETYVGHIIPGGNKK